MCVCVCVVFACVRRTSEQIARLRTAYNGRYVTFGYSKVVHFIVLHWVMGARGGATGRKVAGSIPDGFTGIFHWHNTSGCTMVLGSSQPLIEMSTRNISCGGKGGRCVGLITLPPSCADCHKIWEPQPPGSILVFVRGVFCFCTFTKERIAFLSHLSENCEI